MNKSSVLTFPDPSAAELRDRAQRMFPLAPKFELVELNLSSQFLFGVFSRASLCLPAFYYFLGSSYAHEEAQTSTDYPFRIAQAYSDFSDLNTLTLS